MFFFKKKKKNEIVGKGNKHLQPKEWVNEQTIISCYTSTKGRWWREFQKPKKNQKFRRFLFWICCKKKESFVVMICDVYVFVCTKKKQMHQTQKKKTSVQTKLLINLLNQRKSAMCAFSKIQNVNPYPNVIHTC